MPVLSTTYKINGMPIPEPSSAPVSLNPLHGEASGRTDDGKMHTELIGVKRKVELSYDVLTGEQLAALLALLTLQYYNLTYLDPKDGVKTIECYGAAVEQEPHTLVYYNNKWLNVKFNCIER